MKIDELKPGEFFEFRQAGYCFNRCLYIGIDEQTEQFNFVFQTAGLNRFVHGAVHQTKDGIEVTTDVPKEWKVHREHQ